MIKTKFRRLHSFIAGSLLLAISSASAQTLPDPLSGSFALDVSGGLVTYSGSRTVGGATLSFTSDGSGTRQAILPGSLSGTGALTFDDPGTLSLTGSPRHRWPSRAARFRPPQPANSSLARARTPS